ncbi:MAG: hypothetical protein IJ887_00425 [Prevotella sp.]|nr:hypothetical protein [Prevotella sp.]MBR3479295.1 hypothetical protein [Prevotella sp.]
MERTIFSEKQEKLVQCINHRKHIYQVLWDEKPVETEDNGVQYSYQYTVFKFRPTQEQIKEAVIAGIDSQTDMNIASGFVWNGKPVWLSMENQFNFKAVCDKAVKKDGENLPVKFKLGQDANGNPVYHTFESVEELSGFVDLAEEYVHQCIIDGWARKDSVDWSEYET